MFKYSFRVTIEYWLSCCLFLVSTRWTSVSFLSWANVNLWTKQSVKFRFLSGTCKVSSQLGKTSCTLVVSFSQLSCRQTSSKSLVTTTSHSMKSAPWSMATWNRKPEAGVNVGAQRPRSLRTTGKKGFDTYVFFSRLIDSFQVGLKWTQIFGFFSITCDALCDDTRPVWMRFCRI